MNDVTHDPRESRFVLKVDGNEVFVRYIEDKESIDLYSTYTPEELRRQGFAEKVVRFAFDYAKKKNLQVIPTCWYVKSF